MAERARLMKSKRSKSIGKSERGQDQVAARSPSSGDEAPERSRRTKAEMSSARTTGSKSDAEPDKAEEIDERDGQDELDAVEVEETDGAAGLGSEEGRSRRTTKA